MAVSDWNTTPALNTSISGINIAEGCAPGNLNDAIRQMMADVKTSVDTDIPAAYQAKDTDLTALAGLSTNGLITRTGSGTATVRTITGSGIVSVTNGDGVAGNPTITVSSITTAQIAAATLVTASETIASNNNDTTLPTSAAVDSHIPAKLNASGSAPIYACRAWVNFNGTGTVAIRASGNVSSITDNGTGDYTINFTTAMPDANYAFVASAQNTHNGGFNNTVIGRDIGAAQTTSALRLNCREGATAVDSAQVSVAIFR